MWMRYTKKCGELPKGGCIDFLRSCERGRGIAKETTSPGEDWDLARWNGS